MLQISSRHLASLLTTITLEYMFKHSLLIILRWLNITYKETETRIGNLCVTKPGLILNPILIFHPLLAYFRRLQHPKFQRGHFRRLVWRSHLSFTAIPSTWVCWLKNIFPVLVINYVRKSNQISNAISTKSIFGMNMTPILLYFPQDFKNCIKRWEFTLWVLFIMGVHDSKMLLIEVLMLWWELCYAST